MLRARGYSTACHQPEQVKCSYVSKIQGGITVTVSKSIDFLCQRSFLYDKFHLGIPMWHFVLFLPLSKSLLRGVYMSSLKLFLRLLAKWRRFMFYTTGRQESIRLMTLIYLCESVVGWARFSPIFSPPSPILGLNPQSCKFSVFQSTVLFNPFSSCIYWHAN